MQSFIMIFIDKILLKKVKDAGFCLYCNFMPTYLQVQHLLKRGEEDLTTNVMVSVIFYYTQEFEAITPDIKGHLEHMIENTNIIFLKSRIPMRLSIHCMLNTKLREAPDSADRIREFKESQGEPRS